MTSIKRFGCGEFYITRRSASQVQRNWWLAKRQIDLNKVCVPKELHGKRIRFKIEVLDD